MGGRGGHRRHDGAVATDDYCYLTTTGRHTGQPHRIEIWYAATGNTIYLLAGGGRTSDWVRNLIVEPAVGVEIGSNERAGVARILEPGEEAEQARTLLFDKYSARDNGDLTDWRQRALPVAIDLG